jgi:glycosyltransferase involved in cell wall biosynthesis
MSRELKSSSPLVSVVIAAYNSSRRLRCAVKSVLDQSHQNLEVIVIGDNCTADSEVAVQEINDSRIRCL